MDIEPRKGVVWVLDPSLHPVVKVSAVIPRRRAEGRPHPLRDLVIFAHGAYLPALGPRRRDHGGQESSGLQRRVIQRRRRQALGDFILLRLKEVEDLAGHAPRGLQLWALLV